MYTDKDVERLEKAVKELNAALKPITEDLSIRISEYDEKWYYAHSRRVTELEKIYETRRYLSGLCPWLRSRGLMNINVITGFAPLDEVKVIDPATGNKFSFYNVKTEEEMKNIQALGYEILEKIR